MKNVTETKPVSMRQTGSGRDKLLKDLLNSTNGQTDAHGDRSCFSTAVNRSTAVRHEVIGSVPAGGWKK